MHRRLLPAFTVLLLLVTGCHAAADQSAKRGGVVASRLLDVFEPAGSPADARERAAEAGVRTDSHGVLVDIRTRGLDAGDRALFERDGVRVLHFSVKYERVSASVRDEAALRALASIRPVRAIAPEWGAAGQTGDGKAD